MKTTIAAVASIIVASLFVQYAVADSIPDWIRNNALWWSEGAISQTDFVMGLQFLIQEEILNVPPTSVSGEKSSDIPPWVKNTAAWWAEGTISDTEFVNGVQHLIKLGIITVPNPQMVPEENTVKQVSGDSSLQAELETCQEITRAYDRLKCEDAVELKMKIVEYEQNSQIYEVGPVTFYYPGSDLEITSSGQANLNIQILAINTGSNDNVVLMCTGPSICNYDVWNGDKAFKYSSTDFTSGQLALKPGDAKEINMFFGPNIGYGGTTFEYDSTKDYYFRVSESWGSMNIPLNLE